MAKIINIYSCSLKLKKALDILSKNVFILKSATINEFNAIIIIIENMIVFSINNENNTCIEINIKTENIVVTNTFLLEFSNSFFVFEPFLNKSFISLVSCIAAKILKVTPYIAKIIDKSVIIELNVFLISLASI